MENDAQGRLRATKVTGPNGAFVQGAPRRTYESFDGGNSRRDNYRQNDNDDENSGSFRGF